MEQEVEIKKLINEEKYLARDIRVTAQVYLVLQVLGLGGVIYLGIDPFDFVFDATKWLVMFIGLICYLLFFAILTLRIAFNKEPDIKASKKQLRLILILDIIPGFILMLLALNDLI